MYELGSGFSRGQGMSSNQQSAGMTVYIAVFLVALAGLLYEILLTRLFSATTWYHFAFLSISAAMLGLAAGAIAVHLKPKWFPGERTSERMAQGAWLFGVFSVLGMLVHIYSPAIFGAHSPSDNIMVALAVAFPFILIAFSSLGVCICLALTRFPRQVSSLYAADLCGASIGCIIAIVIANAFDAITNIFFAAGMATLGALLLSAPAKQRLVCGITLGALVGVIGLQLVLSQEYRQPIKLTWSKGIPDSDVLYEKWNSLSHIRIMGNTDNSSPLADPTFSSAVQTDRHPLLHLDIDGSASTDLYKFTGNKSELQFMRADMNSIVHHLRRSASVLIIGMGGGRDVLSAIVAEQPEITAIEINKAIAQAVNDRFGAFTGKLDKLPNVHVIIDEARSATTRLNKKFDIIQASLIDTWAASSSGAYALSENSLYTVECWEMLLKHLKERGVLTITRWAAPNSGEFDRTVSLASEALRKIGVTDTREHIIAIRNTRRLGDVVMPRLGTLLVSPTAFSKEDIATVSELCQRYGYELALAPDSATDEALAQLADLRTRGKAIENAALNLTAPTDDRPFFFYLTRPDRLMQSLSFGGGGAASAMAFLVPVFGLLIFSLIMFDVVRIPLVAARGKKLPPHLPAYIGYFFAIGAGFMLLELYMIQSLIVVLGNPSYGLSVVLFALLLSTGLGSFATGKIKLGRETAWKVAFAAILFALIIFGLVFDSVLAAFLTGSIAERIGIAIATIFPVGICLGAAFPLGMANAVEHENLGPWLWAVNAAASVVGSVLSLIIAMSAGLHAAFWCGVVFYGLAAFCISRFARPLAATEVSST